MADAPELERTFRGEWHVAARPKQKVSGTLTFSPETGVVLDLNGTLLDANNTDFRPTQILGTTFDGTNITISQAQYRSQEVPSHLVSYVDGEPFRVVVSELWSGWAIAVGAWLPEGEGTKISSVTFRSRMLRAWARQIHPKYIPLHEENIAGGTVTLSSPFEALTDLGKVTFAWTKHETTQYGVRMRFIPELSIQFQNEMSIGDAWHSAVVPLLHFLSLATGRGDWLEGLIFTDDANEHEWNLVGKDGYEWGILEGRFEWLTSSWMARPTDREPPYDFEFLLSAPEVTNSFEAIVPSWFKVHARTRHALLDYFAIHMSQAMVFEESFNRVVRSLEVIHGLLYDAPRIGKSDFRRIKQLIKEALSGEEHKQLIMERLSHADAASLKDRLLELIELCGPQIKAQIDARPNFVTRVVSTRNGITHTGDAGEFFEKGDFDEAFYLLDLVMRSVLIREIGIPEDELDKHVMRTRDSRFVQHQFRIE